MISCNMMRQEYRGHTRTAVITEGGIAPARQLLLVSQSAQALVREQLAALEPAMLRY